MTTVADLVIHNARVPVDGDVMRGGVAIQGGIITACSDDESLPDARQRIDAGGRWMLPGAIDPHVHFREPGLTDREDFLSGSTAAASGGVTTVFDMPNTVPPTSTAKLVIEKRALVSRHSLVDFGLYGIVAQENLKEIEGMATDGGVVGFKLYLHQAIHGMQPCDDAALLEAFSRIAETGKVAAVHAENPNIIKANADRLKAEGRTDTRANTEARPAVSEAEMVARCIHYAKVAGTRLHICHVTASETVKVIAAAKAQGMPITSETGPQWLTFTVDDADRMGNVLMFSPPFRSVSDRDALWSALRDGTIDMIATDHAPRLEHEKKVASVWDATSGFIGVETSVPVVMSGVSAGLLGMDRFVDVMAGAAARTFGLAATKGSLGAGMDADVILVDTSKEVEIRAEGLHSRAKVSPFDGMRVQAAVWMCLVRGRIVHGPGSPDSGSGPWGRDALSRQAVNSMSPGSNSSVEAP